MNRWLPILGTIALGILGQFAPDISAAIAAHPHLALGLGTSVAVIKGLLPSPLETK